MIRELKCVLRDSSFGLRMGSGVEDGRQYYQLEWNLKDGSQIAEQYLLS